MKLLKFINALNNARMSVSSLFVLIIVLSLTFMPALSGAFSRFPVFHYSSTTCPQVNVCYNPTYCNSCPAGYTLQVCCLVILHGVCQVAGNTCIPSGGSSTSSLSTTSISSVSSLSTINIGTPPNIGAPNIGAATNAICAIYNTVESIIFILGLMLMILGGAIYAGANVMPGAIRGQIQGYGMGMLLGGIVGVIIAVAAPYVLSFIPGYNGAAISSICAAA
ncbi:MAG: hypothetical protein ACP5TL_00585 [Candidatus Micrarchaeia archaeon]